MDAAAENEKLKEELEQMRADLQEMVEQARQVEQMLEQDLEAAERQLRQSEKQTRDCQHEARTWQDKYLACEQERAVQVASFQADSAALKRDLAKAKASLRDEELKHDDLERHERIVETSLGDLERRYNDLLEKNADLESELAGRDAFAVECQRLKDTVQELQSELQVAQRKAHQADAGGRRTRDGTAQETKEDLQSEASEVSSQKETEYQPTTHVTTAQAIRPATMVRSASVQASSNLLGRLSAISARMSGISETYRMRSAIPVPRRQSTLLSTTLPITSSPSSKPAATPTSSPQPKQEHRPFLAYSPASSKLGKVDAHTPTVRPSTRDLNSETPSRIQQQHVRRASCIPAPSQSPSSARRTSLQPASQVPSSPAQVQRPDVPSTPHGASKTLGRVSALTRPLPRSPTVRHALGGSSFLSHSVHGPILPSTFGSPTVSVRRQSSNLLDATSSASASASAAGKTLAPALPSSWTRAQLAQVEVPLAPGQSTRSLGLTPSHATTTTTTTSASSKMGSPSPTRTMRGRRQSVLNRRL